MSKGKLKQTNQRTKAFLGIGEALIATAVTTGALLNANAAKSAAKTQADAIRSSAKTQANSIKLQNDNNTMLQRESLEASKQQNKENRDQQRDIQMTLQRMAGQETLNNIQEKQKMQLKYGGKSKNHSSYRGGHQPFKVTDGGGAIPLNIDPNGYGLYELYGNDHEHYHKAPGGKNKTGVGIKFNDGSVVEGEGNQNSNQGELLYVTPDDALFISKHSIDGFNPTKAVQNGVHPVDAFNTQEYIKMVNGYNDDGTKRRKSLKKFMGGMNHALSNTITDATNATYGVSNMAGGGIYYAKQQENADTSKDKVSAKCGKRVSLKRKKADWGTYAGATYGAAGNIGGALIGMFGNNAAAGILSDAYGEASDIMVDAYSQMKGIDLNEIKAEDYEAPVSLAVTRLADTNVNPQLERVRRNAEAEKRAINRGTASSAARQQRLAATNDRMRQNQSEIYASKHNADEAIKQENAQRLTQVSADNANRKMQARQNYNAARLNLMQYNNQIENAKIAGIANAKSSALTQTAAANANAATSNASAWGNALTGSAQGFASAYTADQKSKADFAQSYAGYNNEQKVDTAINHIDKDPKYAVQELNKIEKELITKPNDPTLKNQQARLLDALNKAGVNISKYV